MTIILIQKIKGKVTIKMKRRNTIFMKLPKKYYYIYVVPKFKHCPKL